MAEPERDDLRSTVLKRNGPVARDRGRGASPRMYQSLGGARTGGAMVPGHLNSEIKSGTVVPKHIVPG
jgi:hypothetical protein